MGFRMLVGQGLRRVSSRSGQPADPQEGDLWYDSDAVVPDAAASDVTVDSTTLVGTGTDVQAVLEELDNSIAGLSGAVGSATTKYKTADESVQNNTLQDDNHLNLAVAANEVWALEFTLFLSSVAATADFKVATTIPAGATARHGHLGKGVAVTAAEGDAQIQSHGTVTSGMVSGIPAAASLDTVLLYKVIVENSSTAGTVQLQWAQNTTTASDTTVKRGSFMIAHRLA